MRKAIAIGAAVTGCALLFPGRALAGASIAVSPAQVTFGQACVGAPSPPAMVSVTNNGDQNLEVSAISVTGTNAGDFKLQGAGPRTLSPGASFQFNVVFTAAGTGPRSAAVSITSNAPSSPTQVPLSGEGTTRVLEINPDGLVFGDQRIGTSSDDLSVSLASTGSSRVTISSIELAGSHRSDFTMRAPAERTLDPGEDTAISVVFRPRSVRARTAEIVVSSDACAGRTRIGLSGTGTAPDVRVAPSSINLGTVDIGRTGEAAPVVIANAGRAPLRLTRIELSGPAAVDFRFEGVPALPKTLGPGDELLLNASFTPSVDGPREAVLRIDSDDPDSPVLNVPVFGNKLATDSPSPSPSEEEAAPVPQSSLRGRGLKPEPIAARGGAGDWLAIGIVLVLVGGIFTLLFALGRRRAAVEG